MKEVLKGLQNNAKEMEGTLNKLVAFFDQSTKNISTDSGFARMIFVGKALKDVLDTPILEKDGSAVYGLKEKLAMKIKTAGLIEY